MINDNSSAGGGLGVNAEIPSMDRFESMLRLPEPTADENLHWDAPPPF